MESKKALWCWKTCTCDSLFRYKEGIGTLFIIRLKSSSFIPLEGRFFSTPSFSGAPAVTFLPEGEAEKGAQAPHQPPHRCWLAGWIDGQLLGLPPSHPEKTQDFNS